MPTQDKITGGCRCGAIRYEFDGPPAFKHMCACRDCQKFSGGDRLFLLGGPRSGFRLLKGAPTSHAVTADSGARIHRDFCPVCGSPLFLWPEIDGTLYTEADDVVAVTAGSLDDPSGFTPDVAVFVRRAPAWACFPEGVPLHD